MREIDMSDPSLGYEDDVISLAGAGPDFAGLNATAAELADVYEVLSEVDALDDAGLMEFEAEGLEAMTGAELGEWADSLDDREFGNVMAEAAAYGDDGMRYLETVRSIDASLQLANEREAIRRRQDADRPSRRAEDRLAAAVTRLEQRTYVPGQMDFAVPDVEDLFSTGPGLSHGQVRQEMHYQLTGAGPRPPAVIYREPLPPVQSLAGKIGLR